MRNFIKTGLLLVALFVSASVFASVFAQGEVKYGINAGVNLSNMSGDYDGDAKVGFQIGATVDYYLTQELFLQSGLSFTTKGLKFGDEASLANLKISASYLQLPIRLGYAIPVSDGFSVNFNAGPYLAYGIAGNRKLAILGFTDEGDTFGDKGSLERFDFGIGGGVGAEFNAITVNLGYEYGIANASSVDNISAHNTNAFLTVGYKF